MGKKKIKETDKVKGFLKGFKDFITRGNVVDLAIGVLIGGAFGKIVTSLVNDVIMPPIGLLLGDVNFADLRITLKPDVIVDNAITDPGIFIYYGKFIQTTIEFLIIAFVIYFVVNMILRRKQFLAKLEAELNPVVEEPKEVVVPEDIQLLREIRDALKKNNEEK